MAKNILVHGDFKQLREQIRRYKKDEQQVARLDGNFLETEKMWEMMSELDKDEFISKKIIREL